jgi:hypothetical protein
MPDGKATEVPAEAVSEKAQEAVNSIPTMAEIGTGGTERKAERA